MKPQFALANSLAALGVTPSVDLPMQHGQVCLANDSLISQATYLEELTTFAIGYDQPASNRLAVLRDFLTPRRNGGRKVRITQYNEHEPFETVDYNKVKRAPLAEFPEVKQRTSTTVDRTLWNRGLTVKLDRDQIADKPDWQRVHTLWLTDLLMRATVLEALALFAASATTDTWTWNANANPDLDVKQAAITLANATGFKPNRAVMGDAAELLRLGAYEAQDTAGGFARASLMTAEQIATAWGVDRALINAERYNSTANAKQEFVGSKVLLFTAVDAETPSDPSNIVRHVASASFGGGDYAVYLTEVGVKSVYITVENYELLAAQHTSGILQATIQ